MNHMKHFIKCIINTVLLVPLTANALLHTGRLEVSGQIGATSLSVGNSTLPVTTIETDTLHEQVNPVIPEFSIGAGYVFPLDHSLQFNSVRWFPEIKTAINLRYLQQEITGDVYQFQDPSMNNYNYELSLENTRLMLNAALTLFSINEKTALYVLGGVGNTWTTIGYTDTPVANVPGGALNLDNRTNNGFTYEAGAGILYPVDNETVLFLEYRYTHSQSIRTASQGTLNGSPTIITPARFPFHSQTLSFGANWKI